MSIPQVLEVAVGLIVIYYLLGSVVSLITQWINEALESRGKALQQYLIKIVGDKKIEVIKTVRDITEKGLKEAKDLVEAAMLAPQMVKENVKKEEAQEMKKKFEAAGAQVELK